MSLSRSHSHPHSCVRVALVCSCLLRFARRSPRRRSERDGEGGGRKEGRRGDAKRNPSTSTSTAQREHDHSNSDLLTKRLPSFLGLRAIGKRCGAGNRKTVVIIGTTLKQVIVVLGTS